MTIPRHLSHAFYHGYTAAVLGANYFTACPYATQADIDDWCAGYCGAKAWRR